MILINTYRAKIERYLDFRSLLVLFVLTLIFAEYGFYLGLALLLIVMVFDPVYTLPVLFFSGLLKYADVIENFPVDLTLMTYLFFSVLAIINIYRYRASMLIIKEINVLIVLMLLSALFAFYNSPAGFSFLKNSGFLVIIFYIPLLTLIINLDPTGKYERKLIIAFRNVTFLVGGLWIGMGFHNEIFQIEVAQKRAPAFLVAHISAFGEDYLPFGLIIAFCFLYLLTSFLLDKKNLILKLSVLVGLVLLILNLPSRGLVIGLGITVIFLLYELVRAGKLTFYIITFLIASIALACLVYSVFLLDESRQMLLDRLLDLTLTSETVQSRLDSIKIGFYYWLQTPFTGIGMNGVAFYGEDIGLYVHNIFLELIFEYGVIGAIPYVIYFTISFLCFMSVMRHAIIKQETAIIWLCLMYLTLFIHHQFSGTLGNIRMFWILSALMIYMDSNKSSSRHLTINKHA